MLKYKWLCILPATMFALVNLSCPSPNPPATVEVPDLTGMTQVAAVLVLVGADLQLGDVTTAYSDTVAEGLIISQNPVAGATVAPESEVDLVLSLGPEPLLPSLGWSYDCPGIYVMCKKIEQASDGGFYVIGKDSSDMYAFKLTAEGEFDWELRPSRMTTTGTPTELWRRAADMKETPDGGYIVLGDGHIQGDGLSETSFVLVKYNSAREEVWARAYMPQNPYVTGATIGAAPTDVEVLDDGSIVAFGSVYVGWFDQAAYLKVEADGDLINTHVIDSWNNGVKDYQENIEEAQLTSDGGYIIAAHGSTPGPDYSGYLIKTNSVGTWLWAGEYQDQARGYGTETYGVTETADGDFLFCGDILNNIVDDKTLGHGSFIAKVNSAGGLHWFESYALDDQILHPNCIKETPDGGIVAGGYHNGAMLSKFTATGVPLWNYTIEDFSGRVNDIAVTEDGGCVVVCSGGTGGPTRVVKINNVFVPEDK